MTWPDDKIAILIAFAFACCGGATGLMCALNWAGWTSIDWVVVFAPIWIPTAFVFGGMVTIILAMFCIALFEFASPL